MAGPTQRYFRGGSAGRSLVVWDFEIQIISTYAILKFMANSFFHPLGGIHFNRYKTNDVDEALNQAIKKAEDRDRQIQARSQVTFENTVEALCKSSDELDFITNVVTHMASTLGGEWQPKAQLVSQKATAYYTKRSFNKQIFSRLQQASKLKLNKFQKRLLDDIIKTYIRGGINLPQDKKQQLKKIHAELARLSTKFGQNIVKASDKAFLLVKNAGDLDGIDKSQLQVWQNAAKEKGKKGYFIQFSPPAFDIVLSRCSVEKTRLKMHKLARSRAPQNQVIAQKILQLRLQMAKLLGYKDYASYSLEKQMAKNYKTASSFIFNLRQSYKKKFLAEKRELEDFVGKKLQLADIDAGVDLYHARQLYQKTIGLDLNDLQQYFVIENVLQGMFKVLSKLYSVKFVRVNAPTFHKDVEVYDLMGNDNQHIARIWCDWYARPGKQSGAWQNAFFFADRGKGEQKPNLAIVCTNFSPPGKTRPALLTMRDIETMWHEFGHAIHCAFNSTTLEAQNTYGCKWDFIEAPSQIMENWVWQKEVLGLIGKHYKTGKALPKNTVEKLEKSRIFRAAARANYTLFWSELDLKLHHDYDPSKNLANYFRLIKQDYFAVEIPNYDLGICTFSHIFDGGYAAGYYGYKWAEAIESDLFSRFLNEGIVNPKTGADYRQKILARGDEEEPEVLIHNFLGRDYTTAAMLERDGVAT